MSKHAFGCFFLLLAVGVLFPGCRSRMVGVYLDWNAPVRIHLIAGEREIIPDLLEQRQFAKLLESALPRMRVRPGEDLESRYILRLSGQSPEGVAIVRHFHLGPNWIGAGGRLVILSDAETRRMQELIQFILNQAEA